MIPFFSSGADRAKLPCRMRRLYNMQMKDRRSEHLAWVETALQVSNPDLPYLRIWGQSHYGACDRLAFIDVFGIDDDRARRRQVRAEADNMMRRLGYAIGIESGRDV